MQGVDVAIWRRHRRVVAPHGLARDWADHNAPYTVGFWNLLNEGLPLGHACRAVHGPRLFARRRAQSEEPGLEQHLQPAGLRHPVRLKECSPELPRELLPAVLGPKGGQLALELLGSKVCSEQHHHSQRSLDLGQVIKRPITQVFPHVRHGGSHVPLLHNCHKALQVNIHFQGRLQLLQAMAMLSTPSQGGVRLLVAEAGLDVVRLLEDLEFKHFRHCR
mmetsp:Transcript_12773/g.31785  ORF Transcript_12773/g.31785 Transcript_12773/m.31785 type:complete len:219 (-) Transcript_12773:543-1199(-)